VVQLRQDNLAGTLYNLVGFQTNLRWGEQRRVLRLIPGLENAEFMRYGMMHRNTYINSPRDAPANDAVSGPGRPLFSPAKSLVPKGYVGNAATGLVAGLNAARLLTGEHPVIFPTVTMLGALCHYVTHAEAKGFQPMKANFGLLPKPEQAMGKADRYRFYSQRALTAMRRFARDRRLAYDSDLAELALSPETGGRRCSAWSAFLQGSRGLEEDLGLVCGCMFTIYLVASSFQPLLVAIEPGNTDFAALAVPPTVP
jgi:hypothetical protein